MRRRKVNPKKLITLVLVLAGSCILLCIGAYFMGSKIHQDCLKRVAPNADLQNCSFSGDELQGKNLQGADLASAGMSGANLEQTNLSGANLSNANLSNANLSNANLQNSKLINVNLEGANLTGASLEESTWNNVNLVNVSGVNDDILSRWLNVPANQLNITLSRYLIHLESRDDIVDKLGGLYEKGVCDGIGFPETGDYSADEQFHPIILIDDTSYYKSSYEHPTSIGQWEPMALRYASIVGCIGFQNEEAFDTCTYEGPLVVNAYVYTLDIKIFAARSGQLITTEKVYASYPTCPDSITTGGAGATSGIYGPKVNIEDIKKALMPFVNPP